MRQAAAVPPSGPDRWNIQPPPTGSMEHRAGPGRARHETSGAHDAYGTPETATVRNPPEKSRAHATDSWLDHRRVTSSRLGLPPDHVAVVIPSRCRASGPFTVQILEFYSKSRGRSGRRVAGGRAH